MPRELVDHLKQISSLSEESEKLLYSLIRIQSIPKNEELQSIGMTCQTLYFLKSGLARIFYFHEGVDVTEGFMNHFT